MTTLLPPDDDFSSSYLNKADEAEFREALAAFAQPKPDQEQPQAEKGAEEPQAAPGDEVPTFPDYMPPGEPVGEPYGTKGGLLMQQFKMPDGTIEDRPVGENTPEGEPTGGAVQPSELMDPVNIAIDLLTGPMGWGVKAGAKMGLKAAGKQLAESAAKRLTARTAVNEIAKEVGWGLVASGAVDVGGALVNQITDNQFAQLASSLGSPMVTRLGAGAIRKWATTYLKRRGIKAAEASTKDLTLMVKEIKKAAEKGELDEYFAKNLKTLAAEKKANPEWADFEKRLQDLTGKPGDPLIQKIEKTELLAKASEVDAPIGKQPAPGELPDRAFNINMARLQTGDDVKMAMATVTREARSYFKDATRGVRTHEETVKAADAMGLTVKDLLRRRSGQAFESPEQAYAARTLMVQAAETLQYLAKEVQVTGSDQAIFAYRRQKALLYAIEAEVSGGAAETARTLNALAIPAKGGVEARVNQIKDILKATKGQALNLRTEAEMLAALDHPAAIAKFARESQRATTFEALTEVWINSLLSGPQTHVVNSLSNTLTMLYQIPERLLAAGFGNLKGDAEITMGEALAQTFGMIKGLKEGLRLFGKSLWTGESADVFGKMDLPRKRSISSEGLNISGIPGRAVDLLGNIVRLPGRFLTAEDDFFKAIGYRMELNARAYRMARAEGLQGKAAADRINEIISHPPDDIHMAAIDAARYQTFTKDYDGASRKVQELVNKVPALRLVMPFVRTPANIMKFTFERTPVGLFMRGVKADIAAGGARRQLALARVSLGSMVMATTASMAAEGLITGGGPADPKMKKLLRDSGWQPYSIKIGNKYYSYGRLEPIGGLLGMAADISEIAGQASEYEVDKLAAFAIGAIARNVTSKTYLRGLSEVVNTLEDPGRYGERWIQRFAGTVIPTGVAQMARYQDPRLVEVYSIMDEIKSRIPGYRNELGDTQPRRNALGDVVSYSGGLGPDIVSPIYTSEKKDDPVINELLRLKTPISNTPEQIGGVALQPREIDDYQRMAGNDLKVPMPGIGLGKFGFRDVLLALTQGRGSLGKTYRRQSDGPDGGKAYMIKQLQQKFRQAAQAEVKRLHPRVDRLTKEKLEERFEARRPLQ